MNKQIDVGGRRFGLHVSRGNGACPEDSTSRAASEQRASVPPVEILCGWPVSVPSEISVPVRLQGDILIACHKGKTLATQWGFQANDQSLMIHVLSELARNILRCSQPGEASLRISAAGAGWVVVVSAFASPEVSRPQRSGRGVRRRRAQRD